MPYSYSAASRLASTTESTHPDPGCQVKVKVDSAALEDDQLEVASSAVGRRPSPPWQLQQRTTDFVIFVVALQVAATTQPDIIKASSAAQQQSAAATASNATYLRFTPRRTTAQAPQGRRSSQVVL
jgi:hypothetical protein